MADPADGADGAASFLKQKAGPLPVGVWVLAVAGGLGIAWYMRRNATPAVAPVTDPTTDYSQGGNTYTPSGIGNAAGTGVVPVPTAPADNDEWFRRAADALVILGASGAQVQASLSKFLGGESLNPQDRAIVDRAIVLVGNPPTPPPPAPNAPPPPVTVPPRHIPPMPQPNGPKLKVAKPGAPVKPHLVSQTIGRATFGVTSVRGATAYIWLLNGQQVNTTPGTSVTLTGVPRHTRLSVSVIPQNSAGNGPQSGRTDFTSK
jgi:hypothetical protein